MNYRTKCVVQSVLLTRFYKEFKIQPVVGIIVYIQK